MSSQDGKRTCLVFGAGALGLGFLGPELGETCEMVYADVPQKSELLDRLERCGEYAFNETGLVARAVTVRGVRGIVVTDPSALAAALDAAELVFTAVGEANLRNVASALAAATKRRSTARPLRVLCSENGFEIAARLTRYVQQALGEDTAGRLRVGDTVMGRMCQLVSPPPDGFTPVAPGLDWAVAAEPFFGIPVSARVIEGLGRPASALRPMNDAEFAAQEDVKMWAHNGPHAFLAFLGHMQGRQYFCDLADDTRLMGMASKMMREEVGPALLRKHGAALDRNFWHNYASTILRRIVCTCFRDTIARGTRSPMRKLEPLERLVTGVRGIAGCGIAPELYATTLAAAITVAHSMGETEMEFRQVLTDHCGFDPEGEADLIGLIEGRRDWLTHRPIGIG